MKVGTKSLLFGYHQFLLHPILVAAAWTKLYGFPIDPRLWFSFFIHDVGYLGLPNMDGLEGSLHPFVGAKIAHFLFDGINGSRWYLFNLYHSRTMCRTYFGELSQLGYADKLAFMLYPKWLLKTLYFLSGEGTEYYTNFWAKTMNPDGFKDFESWYTAAAATNIKTLGDIPK
jgi:hypothetical protein